MDFDQISFQAWQKRVGCGLYTKEDYTERVPIPTDMQATNMRYLQNYIFPPDQLKEPLKNVKSLRGNVMLVTTNAEAVKISDELQKNFSGESKEFYSIDSAIQTEHPQDLIADNIGDQCIEQLNRKTPGSLPPYKLDVKKGSIMMIITNVAVDLGLCNGTRIQVRFYIYVNFFFNIFYLGYKFYR